MESVSGLFVPVELLAREQGQSVEAVTERIRSGELVGRRHGDGWQVLVRVPPGEHGALPAPSALPAGGGRVVTELEGPVTVTGRVHVVLRDIDVGLFALVALLIKLVVAAILAGLILGGIGFAIMLLVERYGQGLVDLLMGLIGPYLQ